MNLIIRPATDEDIPQLETWLRLELEQTGEGFYNNWDIILATHAERFLTVLTVEGEPIALLAERYGHPLILTVHPRYRGKGYGKELANYMLSKWYSAGVDVLLIEVAPTTALGFWRKFAFEPHTSQSADGYIAAYFIYRRLFTLGDGKRVPVEVFFYPEERQWNQTVAPYRVYRGAGEVLEDGTVQLPERVSSFDANIPKHELSECSVRVMVDNVELFEGELRSQMSNAIGIERGHVTFYLDCIHPSAARASSHRGSPKCSHEVAKGPGANADAL